MKLKAERIRSVYLQPGDLFLCDDGSVDLLYFEQDRWKWTHSIGERLFVRTEQATTEDVPVFRITIETSQSHDPHAYWRGQGQIEGLQWAIEMLNDEVIACSQVNCDSCQSAREWMAQFARRASRMEREWKERKPETLPVPENNLLKAAQAALSALRSYEFGNSAPDLAKEVADALLVDINRERGVSQ